MAEGDARQAALTMAQDKVHELEGDIQSSAAAMAAMEPSMEAQQTENERGSLKRLSGENVLDALLTVEFPNHGEEGPFNLRGADYGNGRITEMPYTWPWINLERDPNVVRRATEAFQNAEATGIDVPSTEGAINAAAGGGDATAGTSSAAL